MFVLVIDNNILGCPLVIDSNMVKVVVYPIELSRDKVVANHSSP